MHGVGLLQALNASVGSVPPVQTTFFNVFPDEFPGFLPVRDVQFSIEVQPGTSPISKAPYAMTPVKLADLKV